MVIWHAGSVPEETEIADSVPTVGVKITVLITWGDGPLHPLAVTCIFTVPEKTLAQVITPVAGFILPAAALLKDQVKPVLFVAVLVYVVVVAFVNWHVSSIPAETLIAAGVPTVGVIVTVRTV